jgi:hypothetical protein
VAQNGDRIAECACSLGLSSLAHQQDDAEEALALARRALDIAVAVRAPHYEVLALLSCGQAEIALGQLAAAAQTYTQAQHLAQGMGLGYRYDAGASLARVAWMQGEHEAALQQAEALILMAAPSTEPAAGDAPDDVHAAVGRFDGAESQRLIELTLHQVLAAVGDPRADAWLRRAHREVQAQAETLQDAALRQMFLAHIPAHREIVALWAARGGP